MDLFDIARRAITQFLVMFSVVALMALLLALDAGRSYSQQPAGNGEEYAWKLAPRGVFADSRIEHAVVGLVDGDAIAAGAGVSSVRYGEQVSPNPDARLFFAAAGFDDPASQLEEARVCRFWTWAPPGAAGPGQVVPVAQALGEALADGLTSLGVETQPCQGVPTQDMADIIVWRVDPNAPFTPDQPDPAVPAFIVPVPSTVPADGSNLAPPATGDAGLL